jgi:membrane-associated phospholipid phosphatase
MVFKGVGKGNIFKVINFLYALGFFSEIVMIILVSCLIYRNPVYLLFYIIGINVNSFINRFLKPLLKDKRPNDPIKFLNSEHFIKNSNAYGMPSGHSQSVFFSIVYLFLSINQIFPWVLVAVIIGILTIFERWYFHNHTIPQLIVGAILGCLIAYLTILVRNELQSKL